MKKYSLIIAILAVIIIPFEVDAMGRRPKDQKPGVIEETAKSDTAVSTIPAHPSKIEFDSLDWKVPLGEPYRVFLANNISAYVASDSSLPLVSVEAYIRNGSLAEPEGKEGIGSMMTRLMRAGGTEKYPADTLDALIDLLAMRFTFAQTESNISFSAAWLSDYTDTAMNIMSQLFYHPAFDESRIARERNIMIEGIRHRFVNPAPTLGIAYRKLMYQGFAPARLTSEKSLASITRDDLIAYHKSVFGGEREIIISIAGKFDRDSMVAKLNAVFAKEMTPMCPLMPEIKVAPRSRALVVHKDITQAYVRMGLPLFRRPHPDYYPVSILNYILGGSGFTSRLGMRVRSDEGLTYSISSSAESNYTYDGTFRIDFYTKTDNYPKAVSIILEELDKVIKDGVTDEELENAKTALIAELPSSFRSPEDIVSTYAWNEFFGRAPDHYAKYPDELRKLTREDLQNAAKKYITPERITYTIVGDTAAINTASAEAEKNGFFTLGSIKDVRVMVADSLESM